MHQSSKIVGKPESHSQSKLKNTAIGHEESPALSNSSNISDSLGHINVHSLELIQDKRQEVGGPIV
jgi:hypothetical protein